MKILAFDAETSYNHVLTFDLWPKFIPHENIEKERSIIMASFSWLNPKTQTFTKPRNISPLDTNKKIDVYHDRDIIKRIAEIIKTADIIVAHNGDKFDIPMLNTRLLINGMEPVPPHKSIDTLKIAKKLRFNSNRLDAIARVLGIGQKERIDNVVWKMLCSVHTTNEEKISALKKMRPYCNQDVVLLSKVYFRFRNMCPTHPAFNLVSGTEDSCPRCGSDGTLKGNASWKHIATTYIYPKFKCMNCGGWCRGIQNIGHVKHRSI